MIKIHIEKKHKTGLLVGTIIAFVGIFVWSFFSSLSFFAVIAIVFGKILIIVTIFDHVRYQKMMRGEDVKRIF